MTRNRGDTVMNQRKPRRELQPDGATEDGANPGLRLLQDLDREEQDHESRENEPPKRTETAYRYEAPGLSWHEGPVGEDDLPWVTPWVAMLGLAVAILYGIAISRVGDPEILMVAASDFVQHVVHAIGFELALVATYKLLKTWLLKRGRHS